MRLEQLGLVIHQRSSLWRRTMSRTAAKKVIAQEAFEASMKGIVCDTNPAVRDEAPQAYKDLGQVSWR